jgi:hypothetical protein
VPVLGVFALAWLGLALYVLLTRLVHDAVETASRRAQDLVVRAGNRDGRAVPGRLRRLPRSVLERAVADPSTPARLAELLAEYLLGRYPAQIVDAARATSRRRRWRRVRALKVLTRARWHIAVPLLEEAIASGDEELVAATVAMLGDLGDARSAALLVEALRGNIFARSRIAAQLDKARVPVSHLLLPLLGDADPQVRFWGTTLLARYAGRPSVDPALARAATDTAPSVRAAAVESLASRHAPAARRTAVTLLEDPVWFVRAHAARALRDLAGETGPAVAALLADESWWVRAAAKETLEARPGAALDVLNGYLEHDDEFARNGAAVVLQNTGVLDSLLSGEAGAETDGGVGATAQRILAAGGRRFAATAVARNGLDPEQLAQLPPETA